MFGRARVWLIAMAALLAVVPTAGAFTGMSIERGGRINLFPVGALTFESGTGTSVVCRVTFGGELRTGPFGNRIREVLGRIETAVWARCETFDIRNFLSSGWSIEVANILGAGEATRPEAVTGVLVLWRSFKVQFVILGATCLYDGDLAFLFPLTRTGTGTREGRVTYLYRQGTLRSLSEYNVSLISGGELCPVAVRLRGSLEPAAETAQTFIFW